MKITRWTLHSTLHGDLLSHASVCEYIFQPSIHVPLMISAHCFQLWVAASECIICLGWNPIMIPDDASMMITRSLGICGAANILKTVPTLRNAVKSVQPNSCYDDCRSSISNGLLAGKQAWAFAEEACICCMDWGIGSGFSAGDPVAAGMDRWILNSIP